MPAGARLGAVDQARQFGAAGADQPGETEHLAGVQVEAARASHAPAVGQIRDLQHRLAARSPGRVLLLVERREVAPDHHAHDALGLDLVAAQRADIAAVAQHRDAVGQLVHLRHAMARCR